MIPNYGREDTRWKDVHSCLSDAGISVYSPGQKTGECSSPYVVVRYAGRYRKGQFSTVQNVYELLCYVPFKQYSKLEQFCCEVKVAMKALYPMFVDLLNDLPDYPDEDVKAHMRTMQYRNNQKIER